jgi:hypothetical protein
MVILLPVSSAQSPEALGERNLRAEIRFLERLVLLLVLLFVLEIRDMNSVNPAYNNPKYKTTPRRPIVISTNWLTASKSRCMVQPASPL